MARDISLQRSGLRLAGWVVLALVVILAAQLGAELWRSGVSVTDLRLTPRHAQELASSVSRAFNNLLAMVLAFIAVAIPITANMYTPRLIEIFMGDRLNLAALLFYALMGANALHVQGMAYDQWTPTIHFAVVWAGGVIGFATLIPYYFYVLGFLDPDTIIARIAARIEHEYRDLAAGVARTSHGEAQRRLHARILHLGNVTLRAVDRNDRDVALASIRAMHRAVGDYAAVKPACPAPWFAVPPDFFTGATQATIDAIVRERVWVEHRCLGQLLLAYNAALGRVPDAVSEISEAARRLALGARGRDDLALVELCVRYINTFVRAAIGRRDLHAIRDVLYQYQRLACDLAKHRPDLALRIARHFKYYADFARHEGLPFVYELAAYEMAVVVEAAYAENAPVGADLLRRFLAFDAEGATVRLTTAKAKLAGFFAGTGRAAELALVREALARAPSAHLAMARENLTGTTDPVFWEITPRQRNLDYVDPARRAEIARVLDEVLAGRDRA